MAGVVVIGVAGGGNGGSDGDGGFVVIVFIFFVFLSFFDAGTFGLFLTANAQGSAAVFTGGAAGGANVFSANGTFRQAADTGGLIALAAVRGAFVAARVFAGMAPVRVVLVHGAAALVTRGSVPVGQADIG